MLALGEGEKPKPRVLPAHTSPALKGALDSRSSPQLPFNVARARGVPSRAPLGSYPALTHNEAPP